MIEVANLRKEYDNVTAVDDISFRAEPGSIFGLLGPNGAGKSTTIGCISGLLKPTTGSIRLLGETVQKARRSLGIVPQELALYEDLSSTDNIAFWGAAYGLRGTELTSAVETALAAVGLEDRAGDAVKTLSGGLKRRLNFACGIVHKPKVLLLDEPTVGVDPQLRVHLLDQVRAQAAAGTCVLYTTHYMEEAQDLCDQLAIIDRGRIIAEGTMDELRNMMGQHDILRLSGRFDGPRVQDAIAGLAGTEIVSLQDDVMTLSAEGATQRLPEVFQVLTGAGAEIRATTLSQASLESLFIKLTGKELRE